MAPTWFFPDLNFGEESGLNEPGLESFKQSESLGRETCQNILDHPDKSGRPRVAEFEYLDLPSTDFPGVAEFRTIFTACRDHVLSSLPAGTGNEARFFETGLELLGRERIPSLRIGDLNTTGLRGADDERGKPFWRLLKGQGFSSLEGVGGGTYGIGQRAPFAHSALRTIIYSTLTLEDQRAFIAKSILASHHSPTRGGVMTQSKGWWCYPPPGDPSRGWSTIRSIDAIPSRYRRASVGTDIYVVGFRATDWQARVRDAALQFFFAAIDAGSLEVRLMENGRTLSEINRENLEGSLLAAAEGARRTQTKAEYSKGLGSTIYYLRALRNPSVTRTKTIPKIGTTTLSIVRDVTNADVPGRWCAMRKPMMLVEDHYSGLLSRFAGVLRVEMDEGNKYLAQMEDPRHSRWHEDEARNWSEPEKKDGKAVRLAIPRFVADTLKELRSESMPALQDIPLLGDFLPLESDPDQDQSDSDIGDGLPVGTTPPESGRLSTRPDVVTPPPKVRKLRPPAGPPPEIGPSAEGGGETPGNDPAGDGGTRGRHGTGEGTARRPGEGPEALVLTRKDVRFRSYLVGPGRYRVVLRSASRLRGEIRLVAIGEDSAYPVQISGVANLTSGGQVSCQGNRLRDLEVATQPLQLEVTLEGSDTVCLGLGD